MKTILLILAGALALALPARAQVVGPVGHGELPSCPDSGGNHLNYVSATGVFSCGTTGGVPALANGTVLGNASGATAPAAALTPAQLTALVQPFTAGLPGAVPASGGGTAHFLRADGTWAAPPEGGGGAVGAHRYWAIGNMIATTRTQPPSMAECYLAATVGGASQIPVASTSTDSYSGAPPSDLYDGNNGTIWGSNNYSPPPFVVFDYGVPVGAAQISVTSRNDATWYVQTPQLFDLWFSDDDVTFRKLGTFNIGAFTSALQTKTIPLPTTL
ncbi:discoidin domain-containing protein [Gluconacetobacter tumulisoli]|nr:discoidin domain-containing protein [Gluconacetobacter tumulisoli]